MLAPILSADDPPVGGASAGTGAVTPTDGGISKPPDAGPVQDSGGAEDGSSLDPDVDFDWTETLPGKRGCSANHYAGSFSCTIEGSPAPVVGQMSFDLVVSMGESSLVIENGHMSDLTLLSTLFGADLQGTLSCVTYQLSAFTQNGQVLGGATFMTTLTGELDPDTVEIIGQLTMVNSLGETCRGAFQASATP